MNRGLLRLPKRQRDCGLYFLEKQTARGHAELAFKWSLTDEFDDYELILNGFSLSTGSQVISFQFSTNGGGSWDAGSVYSSALWIWTHNATAISGVAPGTAIALVQIDNDANWSGGGRFTISLNNDRVYPSVNGQVFGRDQNRGASDPQGMAASCAYMSTKRPNAFRIFPSGGVMSTGTARLYGYKR